MAFCIATVALMEFSDGNLCVGFNFIYIFSHKALFILTCCATLLSVGQLLPSLLSLHYTILLLQLRHGPAAASCTFSSLSLPLFEAQIKFAPGNNEVHQI